MKNLIKRILYIILFPFFNCRVICFFQAAKNHICWKTASSKLAKIGKFSNVCTGFELRGAEYIEIGDYFSAGKSLNLQAWDSYGNEKFTPKLIIGNNVMLTDYVQISCIDRIVLGDNLLVGQNVYISDNSHGNADASAINVPPLERPLTSKGPVIIGENVWIGRNSTILSGVTIGNNAIIGANSVVTRDVPENCVVAGSPAKPIKYLSDEVLRKDC